VVQRRNAGRSPPATEANQPGDAGLDEVAAPPRHLSRRSDGCGEAEPAVERAGPTLLRQEVGAGVPPGEGGGKRMIFRKRSFCHAI